MKQNLLLIAIIIVIVAAALLFGGFYPGQPQQTTTTVPTTTLVTTTVPTTTTTPQPKTYNVEMKNTAFSPSDLTISVGDTVVWTNNDTVNHNVKSDSGSELNSPIITAGQTYSHTFSQAGNFSYHCGLHTSMKAKVTVTV